MRRPPLVPALLVLLAAGLAGWLLWGEMLAGGAEASRRAASRRGGARVDLPSLEAELEEGARLRGLPGIRTAGHGEGRLVGRVHALVPAADGRGAPEAQPLPGVSLQVIGSDGDRTISRLGTTDGEGAFDFDDLPALVGYALVVRHEPYQDVLLRGLAVSRDRTTDAGTILLGAPTVLRGEVVDAAGRPVAGALVQVLRDDAHPGTFDLQRGVEDLQAAVEPLAWSSASSDGTFVVKDVPPGRYVLRVSAPGHATVFREGVWVTLDQRAPAVRVTMDPGAGWTGRVLDEAGVGIGGARVVAVTAGNGRVERLDRVETTSAPDGRYVLDRLVPDVRYLVEAWAPGHAPTGRIVVARGMAELDLVLGATGRIEGRITDARTGRGLPGAEVSVIAGLVNSLSPVATVTDADGRYVLDHVNPGPIFLFAARAPGHATSSFDLGGSEGRQVVAGEVLVLDRALAPGAALHGRVTDEAGAPVAWATVGVTDRRRRWEGERTARTGSDGGYRIEGLAARSYEVRVSAPGYAPLAEDAARVDVGAEDGEVLRDLVLERGARLLGKVTDPFGAPVGAARVRLVAAGGRNAQARVHDLVAVSDAAGHWTLLGVPVRTELSVEVAHDAWAPATAGPFRLTPGEERTVDLVLGEGVRLVGRVTDLRGRPLEGARVRWGEVDADNERRMGEAFSADAFLGPRVVRSASDGGFAVEGLHSGRWLVKVQADGHADYYRRDVTIPVLGDPAPLDVRMTPAASIRGRVVDAATGRPVADAWVYAEERRPGEGEETDPGRVRALVSAQTDEDGRYELRELPPGRHDVIVWLAIGYRTAAQDGREPSCRREDVAGGAVGVDFALLRADAPGEGG